MSSGQPRSPPPVLILSAYVESIHWGSDCGLESARVDVNSSFSAEQLMCLSEPEIPQLCPPWVGSPLRGGGQQGQLQAPVCTAQHNIQRTRQASSAGSLSKNKETSFSEALSTLSFLLTGLNRVTCPPLNQSMWQGMRWPWLTSGFLNRSSERWWDYP